MTVTINGTTGIAGTNGSAGTPAVQGEDTNTGVFFPAADTVAVATGGSERMRLDASGNLGVGTASPNAAAFGRAIEVANATSAASTVTSGSNSYSWVVSSVEDAFRLFDGSTERLRIDTSGNVGIGTSSPAAGFKLNVNGAAVFSGDYNTSTSTNGGGVNIGFNGTDGGKIEALAPGSAWFDMRLGGATMRLFTFGVERARIDGSGNFLVGKTSSSDTVAGISIIANGGNNPYLSAVRENGATAYVNRLLSDGVLIEFAQANVIEGTISVSGTTVSYNGGHLARWAQFPDNSRPDLLKGTVMSNLDQMSAWDGEDNEQLNCVQVSDVEGDPNVAGVFVAWDSTDDEYNDILLAMTGDMVIRIAAGTTVQRGDLLMSAGDGTAKPQEDDIVRSKTIAKVTSTHVSHTYEDGSYAVPCVLMAC